MALTVDEIGRSGSARQRLKELTGTEFHARYDCDRFTATVLANRFRYVVSHVASQLRTHAFSPIIRDAADMCGMLSGPQSLGFPMAAVSETLPLFYGSIPDAVRIVLEEHGVDRLRPNDMILVNDYYRVGTHFNDMCNIRPVFYEGELVGAVTIRAHMLDIGGAWQASRNKRNTYQDGLRLPPILLYSAGEPVASTFNLVYDNTRLGHLIVPDLKTMYHALELGETLLHETIDKYGLPAYLGAMRYVCDISEEAMNDALASLPDGVYEGEEWIDGDGLADSPEYKVHVRMTKVGERAEFDLRGSSGATRSAVNCSWADVKTGVAMALKFLVEQKYPMTSGTLRNIDCVVGPDQIFNPYPPHACFAYFEVVMLIVHAIYRALNPVLGPDALTASKMIQTHHAQGYRRDGTEIPMGFAPHVQCGPWGATQHADGDSTQQPVFQNLMTSGGIETYELERLGTGAPVVVLRSEYVADTGGPGTHRGGASTMNDDLFLYDAEHRPTNLHTRRPTAGGGVYGGHAGPTGAAWLWDPSLSGDGHEPELLPLATHDPVYRRSIPQAGVYDPATFEADAAGEYRYSFDATWMTAGAVVRQLTPGGGGWGDPLDRAPERVRDDVRDGYVTIEGAARDYGVAVRGDPDTLPEQLEVDDDATKRLRSARHAGPNS